MKVALVHDWLYGMRGGEKVLESFCELYPNADIFTLFHVPGSVSTTIESHPIYVSALNRLPFGIKKHRYYLPLFPTLVEQFDLSSYDLVISSSSCVAKGVITRPGTLHISYLFSPMRYVWDLYQDYFGRERAGQLTRLGAAIFAPYLRNWDFYSSSRVDYFVAISNFVKKRIEKFYRREADVIYPPVDVERFKKGKNNKKEDYYLLVSALVPYKRVDLAVLAFNQLGYPLKIAGTGPELPTLRKAARSNISFLEWVGEDDLPDLYAGARGFIFPGVEDFGITVLEAQAAGTPVIAYGAGGALETIIPGKTGLFFDQQTPQRLARTVKEGEEINWDFGELAANADKFGKKRFYREFESFVAEAVKKT